MRGLYGMLAGIALSGCAASTADVTGSAGGVTFGSTTHVYFGGPFVIISMLEVSCEQLDFVRRNYEVGQAPTDAETKMLQFSYDTDAVTAGKIPVSIDAAVSASVVDVSASGAFTEVVAVSGELNVESVETDDFASGTFTAVTFDDGGVLDGTFDAVWCRNLKPR